MFNAKWAGMEEGCYVDTLNVTLDPYIATKTNYTITYKDNPWYANCTKIEAIAPIDQVNPFNRTVCGKRGGLSFKEVVRPDPKTLQCPNGTEPCSNGTDAHSTVCYPPDQHNTSCPINDMVFANA